MIGEKRKMTEKVQTVELKDKEEFPIFLTEEATSAARDAMKSEGLDEAYGLRVGVRGGGCSGLTYILDFEKQNRLGDFVFTIGGLKIFLDPISAMHLEGTTIDYVTSLMGMGFKFINPNATKTCC